MINQKKTPLFDEIVVKDADDIKWVPKVIHFVISRKQNDIVFAQNKMKNGTFNNGLQNMYKK